MDAREETAARPQSSSLSLACARHEIGRSKRKSYGLDHIGVASLISRQALERRVRFSAWPDTTIILPHPCYQKAPCS